MSEAGFPARVRRTALFTSLVPASFSPRKGMGLQRHLAACLLFPGCLGLTDSSRPSFLPGWELVTRTQPVAECCS